MHQTILRILPMCVLFQLLKILLSSNYFFLSGAARRGALARCHKGGRPAGRRKKIASIGSAAAGAALVA